VPASLYGLCFLSGFAALVFEHVYFREAGLIFGNGVWATSVVLASFMAGLALGSLLAARGADRLRRPLIGYAAAEVLVAAGGAAVVWAAPSLGNWLGPWLGGFLERPLLVNALRLASAFLLMCGPTIAMGVTLPLLARAVEGRESRFGVALGNVYGWNTLGAMAGALAGEMFLYSAVGVRGTGLVAAAGSLAAASAAALLSARMPASVPEPPDAGASSAQARLPVRWLLSAAGCGALLLALEVVWTRFFQLFVSGTSVMFAVLLAVVLAGISVGGLLAAALCSRWPAAHTWFGAFALGAGFWVAGGYAWLRDVPSWAAGHATLMPVATLGLAFVFPVALASGVLFTLVGVTLRQDAPAGHSTGLLVAANTGGAMVGALLAGFILLPRLGVERSFLLCAIGYGVLALLAGGAAWRRPAMWGAAVLWLAAVAFFPHGLMNRVYLRQPLSHLYGGGRVVALREGLTETIVYVEGQIEGQAYEHRLITNNYNMSASGIQGRRYMKLYVYLPVALHTHMRKALLISYGVGSTAKALTDTRELESIDVVDISRDVLDLSTVVYPDPRTNPLRDPRVRVHVEDGRYFLRSTRERYDLITAEPPPPKMAGVVNLYSIEFFRLAHEKLAPGGFASYWLPVHTMEPGDVRAIVSAFCGAFPDCTLWKGMGMSWMLMGTREGGPAVSADRFTAQWRDPVVRPELDDLGFERPEQLGALFIADAGALRTWTAGALPLADDFPLRLAPERPITLDRWYLSFAGVEAAQPRFTESPWIRARWPEEMRSASGPYFEWQAAYDRLQFWDRANTLADLDEALNRSSLVTLPLILTGSTPDLQRAARRARAAGNDSAFVWAEEGRAALTHRRYAEAADRLLEARRRSAGSPTMERLRVYALLRAGRTEEARSVLAGLSATAPEDAAAVLFLQRLAAAPR
jgi:spermidine synthase